MLKCNALLLFREKKNNSGVKANPQKAEAITVKVNYFNMGETMSKKALHLLSLNTQALIFYLTFDFLNLMVWFLSFVFHSLSSIPSSLSRLFFMLWEI